MDNIFNSEETALSEKQSESVYYLSSTDFRPFPQKPRIHHESEHLAQSEEDTIEIELASQFYAWLGSLNATEERENSQQENILLEDFCRQEAYCLSIISRTDEILAKLRELKEKYDLVSRKTSSLHETCESILQTQNDLAQKAEEIEQILKHFTILTSIEAKLNAKNVVLSAERMLPVFDAVDSSIAFLERNLAFKDSPVYLSRFRACLTTAIHMVKDGVKNIIRRMIMELLELGDAITPENSFILLYGRFRSQGPRIRSLMSLLENRADRFPEFRDAVTECQTFYLSKREALVLPVAQASISDLICKYSGNHCELLRTTVSFMLHMCEDEIALFGRFFLPDATGVLNSMLANLCHCAYDSLRPFLIHANHIEILTELCSLLKQEFLETESVVNRADLEAFSQMCHNLLVDVRQRLIFRAHVYIKSQILDYSPSPGDLAYPEKLEMIEKIATGLQQSQSEGDGSAHTAEGVADGEDRAQQKVPSGIVQTPTDFHGMWYPTVRRALVCVSNLSRCLDVESFRGLAQNCTAACIESLVRAEKLIAARKTPSDGQLFLIKHLLVLREQLTPFNVEFKVKETSLDFSDLKSAAYQALPKLGSKFFDLSRANALLHVILEGPAVVEVDVDSRRQLDHQLKKTCEEFIEQSVRALTGNLPALLTRAKELASTSAKDVLGPPDRLRDEISGSLRLLNPPAPQVKGAQRPPHSNSLAVLRRKLLTYLTNPTTVTIIMRPIETGVVNSWRQLSTFVAQHYTEEDRMIIACPNDSQVRLLFHV
uniref:Conserved oligomeric Golgi complex subunit 3 n=2 Tax=Schistocephalus solidus TaxID=70667 RepID=A0A0X3Q8J9_SCHSO